MRKKSHITLGNYLLSVTNIGELKQHRKAFLLGSILPDCRPSFVTRRHEYDTTYQEVREEICKLTVECDTEERNERVYWRKVGEVLHYIADYFTYPHDSSFTGTLSEHCHYENRLKHYLRFYVACDSFTQNREKLLPITTLDALYHYIETEHAAYQQEPHNIRVDSVYICRVSRQVLVSIYQIMYRKAQQRHMAEKAA